jgi:hypothetical protein
MDTGRVSSEERSEPWYSKFEIGSGRLKAEVKRQRDSSGTLNGLPVAGSLLRRKSASCWKVSGMIPRSETSAAGKASAPASTMPGSKISWRLAKKG